MVGRTAADFVELVLRSQFDAKRAHDRLLSGSRRFLAGIGNARPEEASQSVFPAPGHDVDVQVRHALAHAIVDGDKGTVGAHARFDGARQALGGREQRLDLRRRQVGKRLIMRPGNQQAVASGQLSNRFSFSISVVRFSRSICAALFLLPWVISNVRRIRSLS